MISIVCFTLRPMYGHKHDGPTATTYPHTPISSVPTTEFPRDMTSYSSTPTWLTDNQSYTDDIEVYEDYYETSTLFDAADEREKRSVSAEFRLDNVSATYDKCHVSTVSNLIRNLTLSNVTLIRLKGFISNRVFTKIRYGSFRKSEYLSGLACTSLLLELKHGTWAERCSLKIW